MTARQRKILFAVSFEVFGILVAGLFLLVLSGSDGARTFSLAAVAATGAMIWSYVFNTVFEAWEARQTRRGRSRLRRVVHAILFEGGLMAVLLPLTAWWLSVSLLEALALEGGLVIVFILYTYAFTCGFDRVFGLPQSSR